MKKKIIYFLTVLLFGLTINTKAKAYECKVKSEYQEVATKSDCEKLQVQAKNTSGDGEQANTKTCTPSECKYATNFNTETHLKFAISSSKEVDIKICSDKQYDGGNSAYSCKCSSGDSNCFTVKDFPLALNSDGSTNPEYRKKIDEMLKNMVTPSGEWNTNNAFAQKLYQYIAENVSCDEGITQDECAKNYIVEHFANTGNDGVGIVYQPCLIINDTSTWSQKTCVTDSSQYQGIKGSGLTENMCKAVAAGTDQPEFKLLASTWCNGTADLGTNFCTTTTSSVVASTTPGTNKPTNKPNKTSKSTESGGPEPKTEPVPSPEPSPEDCPDNDCSSWDPLPTIEPTDYSLPELPAMSNMVCGESYHATIAEFDRDIGEPSCREKVINEYTIGADAVQDNVIVDAGETFSWGETYGSVRKVETKTDGSRAYARQYNAEVAIYNAERVAKHNAMVAVAKATAVYNNIRVRKSNAERMASWYYSQAEGEEDEVKQSNYYNRAASWERTASDLAEDLANAEFNLENTKAMLASVERNYEALRPKFEAELEAAKQCVFDYENVELTIEVEDGVVWTDNEYMMLLGERQDANSILAIEKGTGRLISHDEFYSTGFSRNGYYPLKDVIKYGSEFNFYTVPFYVPTGSYQGSLNETVYAQVGAKTFSYDITCNLHVNNDFYICTSNCQEIYICTNEHCIDNVTFGLNVIFRTISLDNPFPDIGSLSYRERLGKWSYDSNVDIVIKQNRGVKSYEVYQKEPMYTITLTPETIQNIREYNETHSYNDFNMSCEDGLFCRSNFLWNSEFSSIVDGCAMHGDWYSCDGLNREYMEGYYSYLRQ